MSRAAAAPSSARGLQQHLDLDGPVCLSFMSGNVAIQFDIPWPLPVTHPAAHLVLLHLHRLSVCVRRPGELIAELSHVMCLMVQAEAAALTAFRAGLKGSSAAVVASLQAGAAELFEKAAKVVREYTGESTCSCDECL